MARMLADRDSTGLHLTTARRHQRLARRYRQDALADGIEGAIQALAQKADIAGQKLLDLYAATDALAAADADLDDAIRDLHGDSLAHDRGNPGANSAELLFPGGGFGEIIEQPVAQEPASAEALATKVESLGAGHALAPHAAKLRAGAQAILAALGEQQGAIRALKAAQAEEEIAQGTLRRQYEAGYLDSRKRLGRGAAEKLFPRFRTSPDAGEEPAPAPAPAQN